MVVHNILLNDKGLSNENLEFGFVVVQGLIPRAKILLTIGGTFFLGFWPLIVLTLGAFSALYLVSILVRSKSVTKMYIYFYVILE